MILTEISGPAAGASVTITDNGSGDNDPTTGRIEFVGAVGDFTFNQAVAESKPYTGNSSDARQFTSDLHMTSATGGTLLIQVSDTDYQLSPSSGAGTLTLGYGGVTDGTASLQAYMDPNNAAFYTGSGTYTTGLQGPFSGSFSTNTSTDVTENGPFALTTVSTVTLPPSSIMSYTSALDVTPKPVVTIGDFVWNDVNGNGIQDSGEPGIKGVTLTLTGTNSSGQPVTDHATTDASGKYLFVEPPSNAAGYTVAVDSSNFTSGGTLFGWTPTPTLVGSDRSIDSNENPTSGIAPPVGGSDLTIDFGYVNPDVDLTKVADTHTVDAGAQVGFTVTLKNEGVSDATGVSYTDPLPAGLGNDIVWSIDTQSGPTPGAFGLDNSIAGSQHLLFSPTTLHVGDTYTVHIIGTSTKNDASASTLTGTVTNDATVSVGNEPTPDNPGDHEGKDTITIQDVAIGDFVWNDVNGNGLQDSGEPGIKGVTLTLTGKDSSGHSVTDTATTDASGKYLFVEAPSNAAGYTVTVDSSNFASGGALFGWTPTPTLVGSDRTIDSNVNPTSGIAPTAGTSDPTNDFGYVNPDVDLTKVADSHTVDAGSQVGFTVTLKNEGVSDATGVSYSDPLPAGLGNDIVWSIDTQSGPTSGAFSLDNSIAGSQHLLFSPTTLHVGDTYKVHIVGTSTKNDASRSTLTGTVTNDATVSVGNEPTPDNPGDHEGKDTVTIKDVAIGDFVWNDVNGNGLQDSGEPGIKGVTLTLTGTDSSGHSVTDTATTDATGKYLFVEAPSNAAGYTVTVDSSNFAAGGALFGWTPTPTLVGSDRSIDSNKNPTSGIAPPAGSSDLTNDFGYVNPDVDLTKVADTHTVDAGAQVGFTVTLRNEGVSDATGVSYSDPLPAGLGNDIVWSIDTQTLNGNPTSAFSLDNSIAGSQHLQFSPTTLHVADTYKVHIVGTSTKNDASGSTLTGTVTNDATVSVGNEPTPDNPGDHEGKDTITIQDVAIGDFVWNDVNGNGLQNSGEPGIKGVTLTLTGTDSSGHPVTDHATTDANGKYLFVEAPSSAAGYTVTVDSSNFASGGALFGWTPTPTLVGSDRSIDSNVNPTSGISPSAGTSDLTNDFGYVNPDVDIFKTADPHLVNVGGTASFTVELLNEGVSDATGVTYSDPLPAGLGTDIVWSIDTQTLNGNPTSAFSLDNSIAGSQHLLFSPTTLHVGDDYLVTIIGTVSAADAPPPTFHGTVTNTAHVTVGNEPTPDNPGDHTASDSFDVVNQQTATITTNPFVSTTTTPTFNTTPTVSAPPAACNDNYYPNTTSDALTAVPFNESSALAGISPTDGTTIALANGTLKVWYTDEHAMALGVNQVTIKTSGGSNTQGYSVSSMGNNDPAHVSNPSVGGTYVPPSNLATVTPLGLAASQPQGNTDVSGRPLFPSLYVTDITGLDPNSVAAHAGDWQYGGTPIAPNDVYGAWKTFTEVIDKTTSTPTVTLTGSNDPAQNGTNLGNGADPWPSGTTNLGYGAEMTWNVNSLNLIPGHTYRFYVTVHDGDQNKSGGDVGQACVDLLYTGSSSLTPGSAYLSDSATIANGNSPTGSITFYLFKPGDPGTNFATAVYSTMVTVNGNGTYTTAMGNNPVPAYLASASGVYQWVAVYSGDPQNSSMTSPFGSEPATVVTPPCNDNYYPNSSTPLTSTAFNESSALAAVAPTDGTSISLADNTLKVWYTDEHALALGVSQVTIKTSGGSNTQGYNVSSMGNNNPASVINPSVGGSYATPASLGLNPLTVTPGTLAADQPQGNTDVSGRPLFPSLFVTDITGLDPASVAAHANDWQYGGAPIVPNAVYGAWKSFTEVIDQTTSTPTVTLTGGSDPSTKNGWNLAGGDAPPPGTTNLGYGAELTWNVNSLGLIAGHTYRFYVIVHDGDQNKSGGDVGQACVDLVYTGATGTPTPPTGSTVSGTTSKLNDSATLSGGNNVTGSISFYLFKPGDTPNSPTNPTNYVYKDVVPVNGPGTYRTTDSTGNNPGGYAPAGTGTYNWVAIYGGDNHNAPVSSAFGSESQTVNLAAPAIATTAGVNTPPQPCNDTYYPNTTSNPLTSVAFNESDVLAAVSPADGTTMNVSNGTIKVWYSDEHALALGVRQVTIKSNGTFNKGSNIVTVSTTGLLAGDTVTGTGIAAGTTIKTVNSNGTVTLSANTTAAGTNVALTFTTGSNVSVSTLPSDPGSVTNPAVGPAYTPPATQTVTPLQLALQGGTDVSGRPLFPSLYVTDITGLDPNSVAAHDNDWQYGGTPIAPGAVYGTWKAFTESIDNTTSTPTVALTADADPAQNNWNLGAGDAPPAGTASQGYGAEVTWNVNSLGLIPGHSYRFYVIVHDGDQNKAGGDCGQACVDVLVPGTSPTTTTTAPAMPVAPGGANTVTDAATITGGTNPTGQITFKLYDPNGKVVDTEIVTVNGNGTYVTPAGYAPPASAVSGTYQWVASYSGDGNNLPVSSNLGDEPVLVGPTACNENYYPNSTPDALTNVAFNESDVLAATSPADGTSISVANGSLKVWYSDEHALALGVRQYSVKSNAAITNGSYTVTVSTTGLLIGDTVAGAGIPAGTTIVGIGSGTITLSNKATATNAKVALTFTTGSNVSVSPLTSDPSSVTNPQVGPAYTPPSNLATITPTALSLQGGTDVSGRPLFPSLYVTDITGLDPNSVAAHANDWQYGGAPIAPGTVYGTWKAFTESIDNTTATPTVALTADADPAANNWNLAGGDAPPSGTASQGYGAEMTWNVNSLGLIPGHSYRFYVIVHDGDQNKAGGDCGQACVDLIYTGPAISVSGTAYQDTTGNGFSGPDTPLAGVTVNLYQEINGTAGFQLPNGLLGTPGTGDKLVATTTTLSDGSYNLSLANAGTYYVQEVVPSGDVQTGGGPGTTSDGNSYFTINASLYHGYTGNNFDLFQVPTSTVSNVSFVDNTSAPVTTLAGNTNQGDKVTVTFSTGSTPTQVSLVTYIAPGNTFNAATAYQDQVFDSASGTFAANGTYSLTVLIPNSYYEIDFVKGPVIAQFGNPASAPDNGNIFYGSQGRLISSDNDGTSAFSNKPVAAGDFALGGFWGSGPGQNLIKLLNGSASATSLALWLATTFPNLYGAGAGAHSLVNANGTYFTNTQVAGACGKFAGGDQQVLAAALSVYATSTNLAGINIHSTDSHFNTSPAGSGMDTYNVGTNGAAFGVANNTTWTVMQLLVNLNASTSLGAAVSAGANTVFTGINTTGNVNNATLSTAGLAYTPDQVRTAYGVNSVTLDGSGQTIAVVDAYNDPAIFQSLDTFDAQLGRTSGSPSLLQQYGPASSFLTVLGAHGSTTALPTTDPTGGWETEAALDVEWAHAMAPGARIVLVEANSQSLPDLMAAVKTAASLPGVSVVSMSWGFMEGVAALAADEAQYDSYLTTPAGHQGVTFVASTGDYGTADPEYPAFSPNVVAVGGTSLYLGSGGSYLGETGWGSGSSAPGTDVGSGGGISMYEPEPAYQQSVQSTGYRTTPDVSFVADPRTGVWIADTYNHPAGNPFVVAGGTSLAAPSWAGLFALVNQGRVAAGTATFGSAAANEAQQALYSVPQSAFHVITGGTSVGNTAQAGYNLVTGLGSPVANLLLPGMVAYRHSSSAAAKTTAAPPAVTGSSSSSTANAIHNLLGVDNGEVHGGLSAIPTFASSSSAGAAATYSFLPAVYTGVGASVSSGAAPPAGNANNMGTWLGNLNERVVSWFSDVPSGPADAEIAALAIGAMSWNADRAATLAERGTPFATEGPTSSSYSESGNGQAQDGASPLGSVSDGTAEPSTGPCECDLVAAALDDAGPIDLFW
jgi:uncharacterized repeat protein (TIGR01451 family)